MLNIELKARCEDLGRLRETCESLGAEGQEPERQIDTYFSASHGRLKLRESSASGAELIYYDRGDVIGARESHYDLYQVEDPEGLKAILTKALSVRGWAALLSFKGLSITRESCRWSPTRSKACSGRWGSIRNRSSKSPTRPWPTGRRWRKGLAPIDRPAGAEQHPMR